MGAHRMKSMKLIKKLGKQGFKPSNRDGIHYRATLDQKKSRTLFGDLTNKKTILMLFQNLAGEWIVWVRISEASKKRSNAKNQLHQYPLNHNGNGVFKGTVGGIYCDKKCETELAIKISTQELSKAKNYFELKKKMKNASDRKKMRDARQEGVRK